MGTIPVLTSNDLPDNFVAKTGPLFLSALLHWGLFGVLCTQVYIYFSAFTRDPLRNKLFVYGIFTLEVLQTFLLTKSYFDVFAQGFGDARAYDSVGTIWFSVPLLSGIIAFFTETFYALRIYNLSESYWVPGAVTILAIFQLSGGITCAMVLKGAHYFSKLPAMPFAVSSAIWTGGSAVCDVVIAFAMTRYLWKRRAVGSKSTQTLVRRIIRLILETGIVTALVATLTLILTLLPHHISYYQVPAAIIAKIYSNSMMVLLNSRINLSQDRLHDEQTERQLAALSFKRASGTEPTLTIMTTQEVLVFGDVDRRFSLPFSLPRAKAPQMVRSL